MSLEVDWEQQREKVADAIVGAQMIWGVTATVWCVDSRTVPSEIVFDEIDLHNPRRMKGADSHGPVPSLSWRKQSARMHRGCSCVSSKLDALLETGSILRY